MERKAIFGTDEAERYRLNGEEWNFHEEDTQRHLHPLHPYPARFIPQIPEEAMRRWSKPGDTVLDPFCGCGTTLLEGILLKRHCIGVDNNGVACLVSKAKTYPYSRRDLNILLEFEKRFEETLKSAPPAEELWKPNYQNISYWFDDRAVYDLSRLRWTIQELPEHLRPLVLTIFSGIIVRASFQDSDTRYTRISRNYIPDSSIKWFRSKLADITVRLSEIVDLPKAECKIYLADSRNLDFINDGTIDFIVTSPPYLNAYDYHKYHRHRLHWIDADIAMARDLEIGKHDVFTRPRAEPGPFFEDMKKCFLEWHRTLRVGGRALIVTGDAIVSKKAVPVGDIFADMCVEMGFIVEDRFIRRLKVSRKSFNQSARIDEEHMLLLVRN